eukprot:COSAG05_NODE_3091_length_2331_cov_1.383513_2_plen_138_part_00
MLARSSLSCRPPTQHICRTCHAVSCCLLLQVAINRGCGNSGYGNSEPEDSALAVGGWGSGRGTPPGMRKYLHLSVTCLHFLQLCKNDRLSVSSTENSAIESHPQTVSQNSLFSELTTENTDRVSVNACQQTHSYSLV